MELKNSIEKRKEINLISLIPFLFITFILAWGILALYIFLPRQMSSIFGNLSGNHPLFILAVYAPAIAAFIIIIVKAGLLGLRSYLKRVFLWRTSKGWYLFLIIGIPIIFYLGAAINGNLAVNPFPLDSLKVLFIALILSIIKGPVEEFGWRGFALPLLQRKMAPFWAGLVLGIIWGFWHLPAFMLSGTQQSAWSFSPFFIGTISISLIMTALFNDSKGSILLPMLMHFQFMNPIWPDAQPYDTYLLTFITVIIVWFSRKTIFSKTGGITEIIPQAE